MHSLESEYGTFRVEYDSTQTFMDIFLYVGSESIHLGFIKTYQDYKMEMSRIAFSFISTCLSLYRFESKYGLINNIASPNEFRDATLRHLIERNAETYKVRSHYVGQGTDESVGFNPDNTVVDYVEIESLKNTHLFAITTPYGLFRIDSLPGQAKKYIIHHAKPNEEEYELAELFTRRRYFEEGDEYIEVSSIQYLMDCVTHQCEIMSRFRQKEKQPLAVDLAKTLGGNDKLRETLKDKMYSDDPR